MEWLKDSTNKVLVMIGDDVAHPSNYRLNTKNLDWRKETKALVKAGVVVYAVQALGRRHATSFWKGLASEGQGYHLPLNQFSQIGDLINAICFKQQGDEQLQAYETEVQSAGRMNRGMDAIFSIMLGRDVGTKFNFGSKSLDTVPGGRFQVLAVDKDTPIKAFVLEHGLSFKTGRGFYEFTKRELIQERKQVVLVHKTSGDMYSGDKARDMIGAPPGERIKVSPSDITDYTPFVQSTSHNRKLKAGTKFLYEVEDWTP
jgi:hypothetical protein